MTSDTGRQSVLCCHTPTAVPSPPNESTACGYYVRVKRSGGSFVELQDKRATEAQIQVKSISEILPAKFQFTISERCIDATLTQNISLEQFDNQ